MSLPTIEQLRELFRYDPETGEIFRLHSNQTGFDPTKPAGAVSERGYIRIQVGNKTIAAHRIAWALHYGEWPKELDHSDRNRANNRIANLRLATRSQNVANIKGYGNVAAKGVRREYGGKYGACIYTGGVRKYLGYFDTQDEAAHAYNKAAIQHYGEFACLNPIGKDKPAQLDRDQEGAPAFDQAEFDTMVAAGTKAWSGVPADFVEELRGAQEGNAVDNAVEFKERIRRAKENSCSYPNCSCIGGGLFKTCVKTTPANAAAANGDGLTPIEPQNVSDERKSFDEYWNSLDSAGSTDAELEMCEYAAWQAWQARPRHCLALPLSLYPVGTTYGVAAADANGQKGDRNG